MRHQRPHFDLVKHWGHPFAVRDLRIQVGDLCIHLTRSDGVCKLRTCLVSAQ